MKKKFNTFLSFSSKAYSRFLSKAKKKTFFFVALTLINIFGFAKVQSQTQTFNYTGSVQTFTVPAGITSIDVIAKGALGGTNNRGGQGGSVTATIAVTPGDVLNIYVGGTNAYNGGGLGFTAGNKGGGATDEL